MQQQDSSGQQSLDEQLSAIIDGEASEFELRRFLEQLDSQAPDERQRLLDQWERLHRIRSRLQGEPESARASTQFAARLSAKLADEPLPQTEEPQAGVAAQIGNTAASTASATSTGSRFAVAASVALAVVVGFQQFQISEQTDALRLASQSIEAPANPLEQGLPAVNQVDSAPAGVQASVASLNGSEELGEAVDPAEAQRRLQEYLLEHANHAAQQNAQGIVPFARVANFSDEAE